MIGRMAIRGLAVLLVGVIAATGATPAQADLVGYWNFNDGTVTDLTGNGYNGTLVGGTYDAGNTPAVLGGGQSLNLTGGDHYAIIDQGDENAFDFGSAMTVSAWVQGWPDGDWEPYVSKRGESQGWQLRRHGGSDKLSYTLRGTSGNDDGPQGASGVISANPNTWYHIAGTYDGSVRKFYVDGVLDGVENSDSGAINDAAARVVFGARDNNDNNANPPNIGNFARVRMDDVALFDAPLAYNQIAHLATGGDPNALPEAPAVYASNFSARDTQGWFVLNGGAQFRTGDGAGMTPANASGGEAMDNPHETFLVQSKEFKLTGETIDGTNALVVTFAGGAGDQDGAGAIYTTPADVVAANHGNSFSAGQKGLAFYNVDTGQYDATIFENDNGGTNARSFTTAQLTGFGVDPNATYRLQYFENDGGGWGWGQLNSVQVAAEELAAPMPRGGWGTFGVREVKNNGTIGNLTDAMASLESGGGDIFDGTVATINFRDPDNGSSGHIGGDSPYLSNTFGTDDQDFIQAARGRIRIEEAGDYTFYARGDDGFGLTIVGQSFTSVSDNGDGTAVIGNGTAATAGFGDDTMFNNSPGGNVNGFGVINLAAGDYAVEYLFFERAGGAYNELFAAKGVKTSFDGDFLLVGQPEEINTAGIIQPGGWDVTVLRDGANNLGLAISQIEGHWNGAQPGTNVATGNFATINLEDSDGGGGGHGLPRDFFPGDAPGGEDNFAVGALAELRIDDPGTYTFMVYGDDGAQFRLLGSSDWSSTGNTGNTPITDGFQVTGCCQDVFGIVDLEAGTYPVEFIWNEVGGGAYVGVWGAFGAHTSFDANVFQLLGENTREVITPAGLELVGVPEPSSIVLMILGGLGLLAVARRRRKAA
ncbi:MAG: LamG domain-containing protein [Planctomycetes bacterium]|nr:LamG domain-containing protein [Planctomycetota bacterium]